MNETLSDVARIAAFVFGAATVAVAVVVVVLYARLYALSTRLQSKWRGLLPRHVALVGVSYLALMIGTMADMTRFFGDPITWRIPFYGFAYLAGLWAMWDVLGHSRLRLNSLNPPDPTTPPGGYTRGDSSRR